MDLYLAGAGGSTGDAKLCDGGAEDGEGAEVAGLAVLTGSVSIAVTGREVPTSSE